MVHTIDEATLMLLEAQMTREQHPEAGTCAFGGAGGGERSIDKSLSPSASFLRCGTWP